MQCSVYTELACGVLCHKLTKGGPVCVCVGIYMYVYIYMYTHIYVVCVHRTLTCGV